MDIWPKTGPVDFSARPAARRKHTPDTRAVRTAAETIRNSRKPIIVIGGGTQHAAAEIRALAERLNAPVIANHMGLGVLDSRHQLSFNYLGGVLLWPEADLVIGIGTRMMLQADWGIGNKKVVRIDVDEDQIIKLVPTDLAIVSDAIDAISAINAELGKPAGSGWDASTFDKVRSKLTDLCRPLGSQIAFTNAIREALPEDGIFVDEVTQLGHTSRLLFPVYAPRTYLTPAYQGTLGCGLATALGAQVACPDKAVVSLSGDGGFMFNVQELATAAQHDIPLISIVFNDNAFGNVRRIQEQRFGSRFIASDLKNPDFVSMAKSFGLASSRAEDAPALKKAIKEGLAARKPTLIEVPVGELPDPWKLLKATPASVRH